MPRHRALDPAEAALWARVMASVRPIHSRIPTVAVPPEPIPPTPAKRPAKLTPPVKKMPATPIRPGTTLDSGWDRRIERGALTPDSIIDLHGSTLQSAYARLDTGLEQAIAQGDRVLLLVTGNPPRAESERPHARGAIRAAVGDWLAGSRHAGAIAAVRGAHPRHGGAGALYIVLRRQRPPRS